MEWFPDGVTDIDKIREWVTESRHWNPRIRSRHLTKAMKWVRGIRSRGNPDSVDALIAFLGHADEGVQLHAAKGLARIGDPRAIPPLIVSLQDPRSSARWVIARALGLLRATEAVEPLLGIADVSPSAVWALGEIGDARAEEPLIRLLQSRLVRNRDHDFDWLCEVLAALSRLGGGKSRTLLEELWTTSVWLSPDPYDSGATERSWRRASTDTMLRARLAMALGSVGDGGTLGLLMDWLDGEGSHERPGVEPALRRLRKRGVSQRRLRTRPKLPAAQAKTIVTDGSDG